MEIVPPFAVGSLVGFRGFLSYMIGATIGTSLFGLMVDHFGWDGGIVVVFGGVIGCVLFSALSHREIKEAERQSHSDASVLHVQSKLTSRCGGKRATLSWSPAASTNFSTLKKPNALVWVRYCKQKRVVCKRLFRRATPP
jgi:MFS family permease